MLSPLTHALVLLRAFRLMVPPQQDSGVAMGVAIHAPPQLPAIGHVAVGEQVEPGEHPVAAPTVHCGADMPMGKAESAAGLLLRTELPGVKVVGAYYGLGTRQLLIRGDRKRAGSNVGSAARLCGCAEHGWFAC